MTLGDLYSAIDSLKRRGSDLLGQMTDPQTLGDLATGMGRSLLTTPADIGQQMANLAQGNPGNVLGQPQGMDQVRGLLGSPTSDAQDVGEAIGPPMKLAGKALGLLSGKLPAMLAAHIAYHGSPYQFDKFDMSKIGTGEGAQAYGHGLYFAENPNVASIYRDALSPFEVRTQNGPIQEAYGNVSGAEKDALSFVSMAHRSGETDPFGAAGDYLKQFTSGMDQSEAPYYGKVAQILQDWKAQGATAGKSGALYKVDINADPAHYLDWDAPLTEQHPDVIGALQSAGIIGDLKPADKWASGQDIWNNLASSVRSDGLGPQGASQALRDAGIPGIKYKDAGSRAGDGGTHNYVVFDDSLINNLGAAP